jgi:hypothetical protein
MFRFLSYIAQLESSLLAVLLPPLPRPLLVCRSTPLPPPPHTPRTPNPQPRLAGGVVRTVPLRVRPASDTGCLEWHLDLEELAAAFTSKSRVLILNSPHNPTGKVFSREELLAIAAVVPPDVVIISDEVYEVCVRWMGVCVAWEGCVCEIVGILIVSVQRHIQE